MSAQRICSRPGCLMAATTDDGHCVAHQAGDGELRGALMLVADALLVGAQGFTCSEAEAIEGIYRRAGLALLADDFIGEHARGDDETDAHYRLGDEAPSVGEALSRVDEATR